MILMDRVRHIWGNGDARQMEEFSDMIVPGLNDSEKYFNCIDKITYKLSICLLIYTCQRDTILSFTFQWPFKRLYLLLIYLKRYREEMIDMVLYYILLNIRFLYEPQVWFWLFPFFSKQCVKTEKLEVFQTMAKYKEKRWELKWIMHLWNRCPEVLFILSHLWWQHSILRIPKVWHILRVQFFHSSSENIYPHLKALPFQFYKQLPPSWGEK